MKTILVGYDESPEAQRALERAVTIAKALGSKIVVTSVAPVNVSPGRGGPIDSTDTPEDHKVELAHAREFLDAQGVQADYLPGIGHPADTIAQAAKQVSADLVVVGSGEPNLVQRMLGQSVTEGVVHKVDTDLLIVR